MTVYAATGPVIPFRTDTTDLVRAALSALEYDADSGLRPTGFRSGGAGA